MPQARRWSVGQEVSVLAGLIVLVTLFGALTPIFLSEFNLFNLARQTAFLAVIAVGMTFVISGGEIDISVGAIYNLAANVMAILVARNGVDPYVALFAALAVGLLCGAINGVLATALKLPTLIVTLGTMSLFRGVTIILSGGLSIGNFPPSSFYQLGSGKIGPVPLMALVALGVVIAGAWAYRNTVFAKEVLAIGSNVEAARRTGISIRRRKIQMMALSGFMSGLAAVLGLAYVRSASPEAAAYELTAIAAVVVGGTPLTGGVGSVWGTLFGIMVIMVVQNGLFLIGLPEAMRIAATGIMILLAVAVQQLVRYRPAFLRRGGARHAARGTP